VNTLTPCIDDLSRLCSLVNEEAFAFFEVHNTCISSAATTCDVATHLGLDAYILRVEAWVYNHTRRAARRSGRTGPVDYLPGCVLGFMGDGARRPAAQPGHWRGHVVAIVAGRFLLDPTLDQVNEGHPHLGAAPMTIELPPSFWGNYQRGEYPPAADAPTGTLGSTVRYRRYPRQVGWKSLGAYRPCNRRPVAARVIARLHEEWPGAFPQEPAA
jgi:hypothetical protein